MRAFMTALTAMALVAPVVVAPSVEARTVKTWRGKDGKMYCRKSNGTIGLVAGGVAGVLVGRTIDSSGDRTLGTLAGGALGALAGREVDRRISTKHCK